MVSTKRCCWSECNADSRYRERWPKSLKELNESEIKKLMTGLHDSGCSQMCIPCLKSLDRTSVSLSDFPVLYELIGGSLYSDLSQQRLILY